MNRLPICLRMLLLAGSPAWARPVATTIGPRVQDAVLRQAVPRSGSEMRDLFNAVHLGAVFGTVTSTFRSAAHNRAVGGVENSYHLRGQAIDISRRPGVTHRQIDAAFRQAGLQLIESLDEGDHSHFAFGRPQPASPARSFGAVPVVVAAASSPAPVPSAEPAVPLQPRLAADEHGTLLADSFAHPVEGSQ